MKKRYSISKEQCTCGISELYDHVAKIMGVSDLRSKVVYDCRKLSITKKVLEMCIRDRDNRPCSVLEMIIALAIRLEEHIMDDPDIGNRTGQWFWDMIVSLGLGSMDDSKFDKAHAIDVIRRFLDRDYGRDGKGGLFTIEHCRYDMRDIEIWYQANWYLDNIR